MWAQDALAAQLGKLQAIVAEGGDPAMQYILATQTQQQQQHGSNPIKKIITGEQSAPE